MISILMSFMVDDEEDVDGFGVILRDDLEELAHNPFFFFFFEKMAGKIRVKKKTWPSFCLQLLQGLKNLYFFSFLKPIFCSMKHKIKANIDHRLYFFDILILIR